MTAQAGQAMVLTFTLCVCHCLVGLVYEPWNDVRVFNVKIVMSSINIRRNDRGEDGRILSKGRVRLEVIMVSMIQDIDHSFGVRIAKVGTVRRPKMHHLLIDWIGGLVGKDACRQARDAFFDFVLFSQQEDVVIDGQVGAQKLEIVLEISKQSTNHGSQMNHISGLHFGKQGAGLLQIG